jgi:hypothetical protein
MMSQGFENAPDNRIAPIDESSSRIEVQPAIDFGSPIETIEPFHEKN